MDVELEEIVVSGARAGYSDFRRMRRDIAGQAKAIKQQREAARALRNAQFVPFSEAIKAIVEE